MTFEAISNYQTSGRPSKNTSSNSSSDTHDSHLNVLVSENGSCSGLEFVVIPATFQDLLIKGGEFSKVLTDNGMGHTFYKGNIYLTSTSGVELDAAAAETVLHGRLKARFSQSKVERIENFVSEDVWFFIGRPLVRSALRAALFQKISGLQDHLYRELRVFNKKAAVNSGTVRVLYGISFQNFIRVDADQIGLCCDGTLEAFDRDFRVVRDKTIKQGPMTKAYRWNFEALERAYYEPLMNLLLPLDVHVGTMTLSFSKVYLEVSRHPTPPQTKVSAGVLDSWF
jgi:hypothetical protein